MEREDVAAIRFEEGGAVLIRNGTGPLRRREMTMIKALWNDESGASAAEYALILAIVGTGIALAAYTLGTSISNAMNDASNCIANSVKGVC